ncbi:MAG TPA: AEC family transporter [Xanthobacteraceae bacterium]|nr:AEC family transporter [Xanthobacteraceae bacterium]
MSAVIAALVPIFLLILAGTLARRYVATEEAHWIGLERLVYYVLFPALLIETLARADLSRVPIAGVGGALLVAVLTVSALCLALRPVLARRYAVDGPAFTSVFQAATRFQTFVALAVANTLFGQVGLALASVAIVAMIPVLNVINVTVLAHYASPKRPDARALAAALVRNPLIWSCLVGIALNLAHPPIPQPIHAFADALGRSSLALGLLMVGAGLRLRGLLRPAPATFVASALKLVLLPVLALLLAAALGVAGSSLAVVACCASVPTSSSAYVLARQMGGNAELLAEILTVQTLLAAVTMPAVIALVS